MSGETGNATGEAPQKPGFWGKTALAVKGFFTGIVEAAPRAMVFSALAFGGSAAMGYVTGGAFNPLDVTRFDNFLLARYVGSVALGSTIGGVFNSVNQVMHADDPKAAAAPAPVAGRAPARAPEKDNDVAFDGIAQMTPIGQRMNANVSRARP
jgi:hypothetical protein